jgi:hypothetical protein
LSIQYGARKKRRILEYFTLWAPAFLSGLGITLLLMSKYFGPRQVYGYRLEDIGGTIVIAGLTVGIFATLLNMVGGIAKQLVLYLDVGTFSSRASDALASLRELDNQVLRIDKKLDSALHDAVLSPEERASVLQRYSDRVKNEAAADFLSDLEKRAQRSFNERLRDRTIRAQFGKTVDRLTAEINALQRRGTTNLLFGIAITLVGIVMLVVYLFIGSENGIGPWQFFVHYAPRLTLVVLIEVLAYFFLRLYKSNLDDIKYFQNELTNVEAKHAALQAAFFTDDKSLLADVVSSLSKTERNRVLEKGQTTVELEHAKLERDQLREIGKEMASSLASLSARWTGTSEKK